MAELHFTPNEAKILEVLSDGKPRNELKAALDPKYPEMVESALIYVHVNRIRNKLSQIGETVVCISLEGRKMAYQHVRLLHSPYDGRI
jgi:DNA-binding response OmpR family regulator